MNDVVIDIHTHTMSAGAHLRDADMADVRRMAGNSGIDKAVYLFNLDSSSSDPAQPDIVASNDFGMRLAQTAPDFYISFCYLNPANDPGFTRAEIERCIVHGGCKGIKLWIAVHADDKRLDPIMELAAGLDVPVLHHSWYKSTNWEYNESSPVEIANLAERHPQTKIIMAHLAGVRWRGVLDIKHCPNVYIDTSGGPPEADLVEYAVQELGAKRVLFGSDWPFRDFAAQKARVTGAGISDDQKNLILSGNAIRLLHL